MPLFHYRKFFTLASLAIITAFTVQAADKDDHFNEMTIATPYPLIQSVIAADLLISEGKELVTFSIDEHKNRWLMIYAYNGVSKQYEVKEKAILPKKFHHFDLSETQQTLAGKKQQNLYFTSANALYRYQAGQFLPLTQYSSIYLQSEAEFIQRGNFVQDLNDDEFEDIIVTDFKETLLLLGAADNQFTKQSLSIKPRVTINGMGANYSPIKLYFSDVNFDKKTDIAQVGDGEIFIYTQLNNGQFSLLPTIINVNDTISGYEWWTKKDDSGEQLDQSNLVYRKLDELRDVNADGITDMVVRYTKASGVLDRVNDYEIYLGKKQQDELIFSTSANSVIRAEGTLTGLQFIDIDNDKKLEVLLSGFDIGLSQIIGALVAGSIDQDVYIFKMNASDNYEEKPNISKEVELNFSLTSGQSGSAIVQLADITGDGLKELILSEDDDELLIYRGQAGKKSFAKRSRSFETLLPKDGNLVSVTDLNNDGKEDLLMNFSNLDGKDSKSKFKILLAQ
ncbi:hypothetical protein GCM10009111_05510 [Colwellia asteriadis]|uniref:VCBS repeat-containing protein n=1 Tax=Colwellia asteriadis TaxID=517723 RepID=A0ABP3WIE8_9GAMM